MYAQPLPRHVNAHDSTSEQGTLGLKEKVLLTFSGLSLVLLSD